MFRGHLDCFKNHLMEAGLSQNQETMALQTLTTGCFIPMIGENRQLVTYEPVEFEN